jgi:uncharacterized membrane protein YebE (DUF533 family)
MWRGTICAANIDNKITSEELQWLKDRFKNLSFDNEQKKQILMDLESPPQIDEIIPHITVPADRSMLLHFAKIIFHKDGELDLNEKIFHEEFTQKIMSGLDLEKIIDQKQINNVWESDESNLKGGFGLLVKWFMD